MTEEKSAHWLVAALLEEGRKIGLDSRNAISLEAGLDRDFLRALEKRGEHASVRVDNLEKLAAAVGTTVERLTARRNVAARPGFTRGGRRYEPEDRTGGPRIPVLGTATGGAIASFLLSNDPIDHVARPPALVGVPDAYALYVRNDSMHPMHSAGDLRFVHPHRPPRPGDSVIIQVMTDGGEQAAYIKLLEKQTPEWLIARQINPPAEIKFKPATVKFVHKVLTTNELFNA